MNAKFIISLTAVVIAVLGLMYWAGGKQPAPVDVTTDINRASMLSIAESVYDFGKISMAKGNVTKVFTITNASTTDVTVAKVETSCMCTTAYYISGEGKRAGPFGMPGMGGGHGAVDSSNLGAVIKPGESRQVEVVYDPNAHGPAGVGQIDRFVYVQDSEGGVLKLEIKADVTP